MILNDLSVIEMVFKKKSIRFICYLIIISPKTLISAEGQT